ncbi:hypothetical protein HYZ76_01345 [Candidatus Falkowbacteria bacterium]|nr:hypothetical protein [Candidatus Falkowbacteria bacterium]
MTKIFITLIAALMIFSFNFSGVAAIDLTEKLDVIGEKTGQPTGNTLPEVAGGVISVFLAILGIVFLAYTIYGGYQWMMARGNEEQLTKAKSIIRGSIIGIIIVLMAYAITAFVVGRLADVTGYSPAPTSATN